MSEKLYFTYDEIHQMVAELSEKIREFRPEIIIAIGGGGYIPARMLRTHLNIPIYAISLELYDDTTSTRRKEILKRQWLDDTTVVKDKRVLVVDEVDDSGMTLSYCVRELQKHEPASLAVAVVHKKIKEKADQLDESIRYFSAADIPDMWVVYPWER